MADPMPFVQVACFCENILDEKDGVLSAVRIVDTFTLPPLPPGVELPDGVHGIVMLNGLINLKSGDFVGDGKVRVIMHTPTGKEIPISPPDGWSATLKGGAHGTNIKIQLPLGVKTFGLIWFDVLWNDELLTRIPVKLQQGTAPDAPAPSSPS